MSDAVRYERDGAVGVITVSNPPVNALSQAVRQGLLDATKALEADDEATAGVLICDGRTFIAGADITEFGKGALTPPFNLVLERIENASKPIVAAIHGTALGGGLETALACHYRCAVPGAQVGLPEVKLGLLPGAGGTQRLPRLIGVPEALQMITSGDPVRAPRAQELGIVDRVVSGELLADAKAYAAELAKDGAPRRRIRDMEDKLQLARQNPNIFDEFRQQIAHRFRGFEAPYRIIDTVEAAVNLRFEDGLKKEQELFLGLMTGTQSAAQRYLFFSEREVAKIPDVPKGTPAQPMRRVAVLGAGTMGGGIAMNFANAGVPVTMIDVAQEQVERGMATIRGNYAATVSKGRLSQQAMDERMALITPSTERDAMGEADMVIEAVFEEMDLKKEVFADLDRRCRPDAIMATNTSTLDVNEIAGATSRPEQVIGTHFFSPANVMRLCEVVRGDKTSVETIATTMEMARAIGKIAVLVGVCDGFVGNRMLHQRRREAEFLLEEGALPQHIDKVLFEFGFPMGPFAMGDLAGLDVSWRIRKRQAASRPAGQRYSSIADKICEMGRFGQKTGAGWYRYEEGSRIPMPDPEVEALILAESERLGIDRRDITDEEIIARCIYPMINEGAKLLEEGIALRACDIDVIWVYGYGWPRYRGGPMFYGDTVGLDNVLSALQEFQQQHGDVFKPAALLERLVAEGGSFQNYRS
jgi:3-hydroxyacyl-CoA dehydrogenase